MVFDLQKVDDHHSNFGWLTYEKSVPQGKPVNQIYGILKSQIREAEEG